MAETTEQPAPAASEEVKPEVKTEVKDVSRETSVVKDKAEALPKETPKEAPKPDTALKPDDTAKTPTPGDWPDDWRSKMSAGDEKKLKRLERFASPREILDFALNVEKSWKQGKDPEPFPEKGTDEEKATWRKDHKIPNDPVEYIKDFSLPDGLVIGDNDKPLVNDYLATAHQMNLPPDEVKGNLAWYFKTRDKQIQDRMAKDEEDKRTTGESLKAEYGADFKKNLGAAYGLLETAPEGVLGALTEARMADGTKLGNNPQIVRWLTNLALEINPAAAIIPGGGAGAMASVDSRMKEIENIMGSDRNKYYRDGLDKEYQNLVEVKQRANKRAA